ncbi:hypothetical protein KUTeg_009952 [Tegillarca granosa]|uniref:Ubiquitin-like domain-containing protein n=1 Tax=Tegillarca granosa TaxID=220873 RepID=A0ABQ9F5C5_TEGGR|nr:hypothetical protein KUTeg_009952 [Tegillarca granosa]
MRGVHRLLEHTKKQTMTRKARKAYNNLTAARHTLIVDEYQSLQTEFSEPDVICLEDDEDNSPLTVRIKYGVKVHKFKLKRNEMFEKVRIEMGKREGINPHQILLIHKDKTVHRTDTPDSLDLDVADILECHVVKDSDVIDDHVDEFNCLTIYVQSKNSKQKQEYKIDKFKPIEVLLRKYALQNNEELSKLRLQFDGDELDSLDTPEDLDLEDGFCLDIISTS